jgi:hypothetical protein
MSVQRKLNAVLFELQTAQTPLARAKVLARSWRTLRELSPTDRRLLARQAGFDGAEELLEGLAKRKGGWGPAMLLEVLGNARSADASTVSEIVRGLRTPSLRKDALRQGAEYATELLAEPEEIQSADGEEPADEGAVGEEPAGEGEPTPLDEFAAPVPIVVAGEDVEIDEELVAEPATADEVPALELAGGEEAEPEPAKLPEHAKSPEPAKPPAVDWSRWDLASASVPVAEAVGATAISAFSATGEVVARAPGESASGTLALLATLRRELPGLRGAGLDRVRDLLAALPPGWPRRRALAALLEGGVPARAADALELIADFERELDRRWCLGVLARRGGLQGAELDRALGLLSSPSARRRVRRAAEHTISKDHSAA